VEVELDSGEAIIELQEMLELASGKPYHKASGDTRILAF